ncbi:MAG: hypothetical protein QOF95_3263 [Pseudonocardiales bacterium]|jgi:hypothetical protein|nr:hypothetical protein [Pseudonocardiales bacterium]
MLTWKPEFLPLTGLCITVAPPPTPSLGGGAQLPLRGRAEDCDNPVMQRIECRITVMLWLARRLGILH